VDGLSWANVALGRGVTIGELTESPRVRSTRPPDDRQSGLGAGAFGSLEQHSQGRAGAARPGRFNARAVGDSADADRAGDDGVTALQQHAGERGPKQQLPRSFLRATPEVPAIASLTIDNIPTIAARTTQEKRR